MYWYSLGNLPTVSLCQSMLCWMLRWSELPCRQCSSGLQAVADVAAAIKAGFYTIGIGAGVETMSQNPMAWEGGVNPRVAESQNAQNCLVPMGANAC